MTIEQKHPTPPIVQIAQADNGGDADYTWLPDMKAALRKAGVRS